MLPPRGFVTAPEDFVGWARDRRGLRLEDSFLERNEERLRGNHRMRRPIQGLHRLADLDALVEQERARGSRAP
jgi:deoxyribodipyrimidine photolyase-like uncharacterized protein